MQAKELYELGVAAYNGNENARMTWFATLYPAVIKACKTYKVLPSLVMAKAATESGWASDLYEKTLENQFGVKLRHKAQQHNNIIALNAFPDNYKYLPEYPLPAWEKTRDTFVDYGPHYQNGKLVVKEERWKDFRTVEDCVEDWCANIRWQAKNAGKPWKMTLCDQLVAIETYTPEGAKAAHKGMHFVWQDTILDFFGKYGLGRYDRETFPKRQEAMNTVAMDEYAREAYEYTHKFCTYGPSGTVYPPADPPQCKNDCVGEVFRLMYEMGRYPRQRTIDEVVDLCEENGMIYSEDINDVWRHHAVACFQDLHNKGTHHVNHVYYSLGGKSVDCISKYDLGSNERINAKQPFENVKAHEWPGKYNFLCCLYCADDGEMDKFTGEPIFEAKLKCDYDLRRLAGRKLAKTGYVVAKGTKVEVIAVLSTSKYNRWCYVKIGSVHGWIYKYYLSYKKYTVPNEKKEVKAPDGYLNCRVGAGEKYESFAPYPKAKNGTRLRIVNAVKAEGGGKWYCVYKDGYFFFVAGVWLA